MAPSEICISPNGERLKALTLVDLFRHAEKFGNLTIYSSALKPPPECYRAAIQFESIPGTKLVARSEFKRSIEFALIEAIDRAERIVGNYK